MKKLDIISTDQLSKNLIDQFGSKDPCDEIIIKEDLNIIMDCLKEYLNDEELNILFLNKIYDISLIDISRKLKISIQLIMSKSKQIENKISLISKMDGIKEILR